MAERPLGIADLLDRHAAGMLPDQHPVLDDYWYWCRRHERAEHISDHIACTPECQHAMSVVPARDCIRIGPFMSEREANRLGLVVHENHWETDSPVDQPLGMEVEQ